MQSRLETHHSGMGLAQKPITAIDENFLPDKPLIETLTVTVAVVGSVLMLVFVAIACICCYKRRHTHRYNGYSSYTDSRRDTYPLEDLLSKPSLADPESVFSEASFNGHMPLQTNSWVGLSGEDSSVTNEGVGSNSPVVDDKDPMPPYASSKVNNTEKMTHGISTQRTWSSQRITKAAKIQEANEEMRRYSAMNESTNKLNPKKTEGDKSQNTPQANEATESSNQRTSETLSESEDAKAKFYLSPSKVKIHRDSLTPGVNSFLTSTRCSFSHEVGHMAYGNKVPRTSLPRTGESEDEENNITQESNSPEVVAETTNAPAQADDDQTQTTNSGTVTVKNSSHIVSLETGEDQVKAQSSVRAQHRKSDPLCGADTQAGITSDAIVSFTGVPAIINTNIAGSISLRANTNQQTNVSHNQETQRDAGSKRGTMRRAFSCVQSNDMNDSEVGGCRKKTFSLNLQIDFHFDDNCHNDGNRCQSVPMVIHGPVEDYMKSVISGGSNEPQAQGDGATVAVCKNEDKEHTANNMKEKLLEESFASKSIILNSTKRLNRKRCSEPLVFANSLYNSVVEKAACRRYSGQDTLQPQQPSLLNITKLAGAKINESRIEENLPYVPSVQHDTDTSNSHNEMCPPQSEKKVDNSAVPETKETNIVKEEDTDVLTQDSISDTCVEGNHSKMGSGVNNYEPQKDEPGVDSSGVGQSVSLTAPSELSNPHEDSPRSKNSENSKETAANTVIITVDENQNFDKQHCTTEETKLKDGSKSLLKEKAPADEVFSDTEVERGVSLDNSFSGGKTSSEKFKQVRADKRRSMSDGDLGDSNSFYLRFPSYGKYATINEGLNIPVASKRKVQMRKPVPLPRTSRPDSAVVKTAERHSQDVAEVDGQNQNVNLCESSAPTSQADKEVEEVSGNLSNAPLSLMPEETQTIDSDAQPVGRRIQRYQGPKRHGGFFGQKEAEKREKDKGYEETKEVGKQEEDFYKPSKSPVNIMTHSHRKTSHEEKLSRKDISSLLKSTSQPTLGTEKELRCPSPKQLISTDSCNNRIPVIYIEENTKSGSSGEDEAGRLEDISGQSGEGRTRQSGERQTRRVISYDSYHDSCLEGKLELGSKTLDESDESDYDNPWDDLDSAVQRASMRYNRRPSRIAAGDTKTWLKSAEDLGRLMEEAEKRRQLRQTATKSTCQVTSPTSPGENLTIPFTRFSPHRHTVKGIVSPPQLAISQSSEDILKNPKLSLLRSAEIAIENKKAIDAHRPKSLSSRVKAKISSPETKKRKK